MINITNQLPTPPAADDLLKQGAQLHNAGNFAGAEQHYRQVLATEPNHPVANNLMGLLALHMQKFTEAAGYFEKAITAQPEFARAHSNFATALASMKRTEEAIVHYR